MVRQGQRPQARCWSLYAFNKLNFMIRSIYFMLRPTSFMIMLFFVLVISFDILFFAFEFVSAEEPVNKCLEGRLHLSPITELFLENPPVYIEELLEMNALVPKPCLVIDRHDFMLEVWINYLSHLTYSRAQTLTIEEFMEIINLLCRMSEILCIQTTDPCGIPFEGEQFMSATMRIFELLDLPFG